MLPDLSAHTPLHASSVSSVEQLGTPCINGTLKAFLNAISDCRHEAAGEGRPGLVQQRDRQ